jgi:glucosamine--fructose-6-phosphate aminotransferase (isomerizing)
MTTTVGQHTREEIASQPLVWQATLDGYSHQRAGLSGILDGAATKDFVVTGCGSTHYLAISAAALLRREGLRALALPAAEIRFSAETLPPGDTILLAISRSGSTTETLWALEAYRERYPQGCVLAITTVPDSPLALQADLALTAPKAREESVAQTRSFASMLLLAQSLAETLAGRDGSMDALLTLPGALSSLMERIGRLPQQIGEDLSFQRFFFLGSGHLYGIASEAMLKTKEMTLSWSEAYHPLEFRHGPMSVVNEQSLVVGLISDGSAAAERHVLQDMKGLGARVWAVVEDASTADWSLADYLIELQSGLDTWQRTALYLPAIQWMAFHRALAKGLNPDQPHNLKAVIEL